MTEEPKPDRKPMKPRKSGKAKPPPKPSDNGEAPFIAQKPHIPDPETNRSSIATCLADLTERERGWVWPGIVPLGVVTVLTGPQGVGKTAIHAEVAKRVTTGCVLNQRDGYSGEAVLWFSSEDDPRSVLLPRLRIAGVRIERVYTPDYDPQGLLRRKTTIPQDAKAIGDLAFRVGARLIIFEPLTGYMAPGMSPNDPLQVRTVMDALGTTAAEHDLAIFATLHPRKQRSGSPLEWVSGSAAWTQAARQVVLADFHPDSQGDFLMAVIKPCSSVQVKPWRYQLVKSGGAPVMQLVKEEDIDMREIAELGDLGELAERADALAWMQAELTEEQESAQLYRRWQAQGYGRSLWWRCRRKLGVRYRRQGTQMQQQTYLFIPKEGEA